MQAQINYAINLYLNYIIFVDTIILIAHFKKKIIDHHYIYYNDGESHNERSVITLKGLHPVTRASVMTFIVPGGEKGGEGREREEGAKPRVRGPGCARHIERPGF